MPATKDGVMPSATFEDLSQRYGVMPVSGGQQTEEELAAAKAEADTKAKADEEAKAKAEADELITLGVDEKSREVIRKERDARKDAASRAKAAENELATLRAKEAEREVAAKKAADEDAVKRGEFEKLATERGDTIATLTSERDDFKTRYEQSLETIRPGVEADWKDLPEEVVALYSGADDDILAKAAHVQRTKALVEKLTGAARTARVSLTPRAKGNADADDQAKRGISDLVRSRF